MNRNSNERFATVPEAHIRRSKFVMPSQLKTTFNVGQLVPFFCEEVLPGDTFNVKSSKVVRMQTPLYPIMDNLYLDTYYFFVPNRLVWSHWENFMGQNDSSAWIPQVEYSVPQVEAPLTGWQVGTIADYFGIPTGIQGLRVNALPFRAYGLIVNDWFRDENLQNPVNIPLSDSSRPGSNGGDYVQDVCGGGKPFIVCKRHDYFTSALPSPQKGPEVDLPLAGGTAPVFASSSNIPLSLQTNGIIFNSSVDASPGSVYESAFKASGTSYELSANTGAPSAGEYRHLFPANLWAQLDAIGSVSINSMRIAIAAQQFYEKLARGGSRYIETIRSMFGVVNPDYRLQRSEYLGGDRVPININSVVQSSSGVTDSPLGNVGAQSVTTDRNQDFTKSFTEHGFVIGLMCVRYDHSYQQGIRKMWSRKSMFDYYFPIFANLGEMPIKNKEIYATGTAKDDEVFGYQEAWAEYRYRPSFVTGEMRSAYDKTLDSWHLADYYSAQPYLSSGWIQEDGKTLDRCLAVSSDLSAQFFCDIGTWLEATRPLPVYSVPGLDKI